MAKMSVPSVFCGEGLYRILPGIFSTLYNEQGRENISGTNNRLNNTGPGTGTGALSFTRWHCQHGSQSQPASSHLVPWVSASPDTSHQQEGCKCPNSGGSEGLPVQRWSRHTSPPRAKDCHCCFHNTEVADASSSLLWQPWTLSVIRMSNFVWKLTTFCLQVFFTHWLP